MPKGHYKNLPEQAFIIYAYETENLNAWQKKYRHPCAYGVWIPAGTVVARSPQEACHKARHRPKDKREPDQRIAERYRYCIKLQAKPSFKRE